MSGRESQVHAMMSEYYAYRNQAAPLPAMTSLVSFSATTDEQIVIYDHWEDGFEPDPFVPGTAQTSTLVFRMKRGQTVSLLSDNAQNASIPAGNCVPANFTANATAGCAFTGNNMNSTGVGFVACRYTCDAVPIAGRTAAQVRFDGGDSIIAFGGPLSLVHEMYPRALTGTDSAVVIAVAVEHFSKQSTSGFNSFRIPVGQSAVNPPVNGNAATTDPFFFARAVVTAFENDTTVTLDNGTATTTFTLQRGETYATANAQGAGSTINETAATSLRLTSGMRVDADKEVSVAMLNGGPGQFNLNMSAILPVRAYGRDFVIPTSPTASGISQRVYLFNPNPTAASVTRFDSGSPTTGTGFSVPAGQSQSIDIPRGASLNTYPSATRLRATQPVWGFVINDTGAAAYDYSYALLPTRFLANEYVLPTTPDARGGASNGNAVFIVPLEDFTDVQIYYPGATTPSFVDVSCDGEIHTREPGPCGILGCFLTPPNPPFVGDDCTDAPGERFISNCLSTNTAPTYRLRTYSSSHNAYAAGTSVFQFCGGSAGLNDLAGTRIVATAPIMVVYATEPRVASETANTDFGFTIVPPSPLLVEDPVVADLSATPSTLSTNGTSTLSMIARAGSLDANGSSFSLVIDPDMLDPVPTVGSLPQATFTNGTTSAQVIATQIGGLDADGRATYQFALAGGLDVLEAGDVLTGTLALRQRAGIAAPVSVVDLTFIGTIAGTAVRPTASLSIRQSALRVSINGPAFVAPGATPTYTVAVTNGNAAGTIGAVRMIYPIPEGFDYVSSSGAACALQAATRELDCSIGSLTAGASASVSVTVSVAALPLGSTITSRPRAASGAADSELAYASPFVTTLQIPDWTVTALVLPTTVARGGSFIVSAEVNNVSAVNATAGFVAIAIPTGFTFDNLAELDSGGGFSAATLVAGPTVAEGEYAIVGSEVHVGIGTTAALSQERVRLRIRVPIGAPIGEYGIRALMRSAETPLPVGSPITTVTVVGDPDAQGPQFDVTAPATSTTDQPRLVGTVVDATGLASATYSLCEGPCSAPINCAAATTLGANASFGSFNVALTPPVLATGTYCVQLTATDTVGPTANVSTLDRQFTVSIDNTPPATPTITSPDAGSTQSGAGFFVTGTSEPNGTVRAMVGLTAINDIPVNAAGAWSFFTGGGLADGALVVTVFARDQAGNEQPTAATRNFVIDATAPGAPLLTAPAQAPTLQPASFTLVGTAEASSTIVGQIFDGATPVGSFESTVTSTGTFAVGIGPLPSGTYSIRVRARDAFSNLSNETSGDYAIDGSAPVSPTITSPLNEAIVQTAFVISGTAEPGSQIAGDAGGEPINTVADGSGDWTASVSGLSEGVAIITVVATDSVGNASTPTTRTVFVDGTAPPAPAIQSPVDGATVSGAGFDLTGIAEANSTVDVYSGNTLVGTGVADGSGAFTIAIGAQPHGALALTVTATDAALNVSAPTVVAYQVDANAPTAPVILSPLANDLVGANTLVTGTAEAGSTVNISAPGATTVTTTAELDGTFSVTISGLPNGPLTLTATATDGVGNISLPATVDVVVDAVPPAAPVIATPLEGDDVGTMVTVTGAAVPGTLVTVSAPGVAAVTGVAALDGSFSIVLSGLTTGTTTISVTASDEVGNVSPADTVTVDVDSDAPLIPIVTSPIEGPVASTAVSVTGTAEPLATVTVMVSGGTPITTTADADGHFSVDLTGLSEGPITISVTATDTAGNVSPAAEVDIVVDTSAPAAPVITAPASGTFVGASTVVTGTAEPGTIVSVVVLPGGAPVTATVAPDGTFSVTLTDLPSGPVTLSVSVTDAAGNVSPATERSFTVDIEAPAPATLTNPAPGEDTLGEVLSVITGTAEPGATVRITVDGVTHDVVADANGHFTLTLDPPLSAGDHTVSVVVIDAAGNTSPPLDRSFSVADGAGDEVFRVAGGGCRCSSQGSAMDASWLLLGVWLFARRCRRARAL